MSFTNIFKMSARKCTLTATYGLTAVDGRFLYSVMGAFITDGLSASILDAVYSADQTEAGYWKEYHAVHD